MIVDSAPEAACFPGEKAHEAVEAGWDAVLFVNHHNGDAASSTVPFCGSGAFVDVVVGVCTTHAAFHRLFDTAPLDAPWTYPDGPALGAIGAEIEVGSLFDGWGYVHLYDRQTLAELDTYAIPQAHDEVALRALVALALLTACSASPVKPITVESAEYPQVTIECRGDQGLSKRDCRAWAESLLATSEVAPSALVLTHRTGNARCGADYVAAGGLVTTTAAVRCPER